MKTLVIIPAYNEASAIGLVVSGVISHGYPVVVIDDGSRDNTIMVARQAGAVVLGHLINRGQGAALKTGISYAVANDYEAVVFFDADGQMAPAEIGKIIAPIIEGRADVVLGSRFLGQVINLSAIKRLVLTLARWFTIATSGLKLTDVHNGFQAWRLSALKKITLKQDRQAYASELLYEIARHKLRYIEQPVTISYTAYSVSKGQSVMNAFNIVWSLIIRQ